MDIQKTAEQRSEAIRAEIAKRYGVNGINGMASIFLSQQDPQYHIAKAYELLAHDLKNDKAIKALNYGSVCLTWLERASWHRGRAAELLRAARLGLIPSNPITLISW